MEICPVRGAMIHVDRQTHRWHDEASGCFSHLWMCLKKELRRFCSKCTFWGHLPVLHVQLGIQST